MRQCICSNNTCFPVQPHNVSMNANRHCSFNGRMIVRGLLWGFTLSTVVAEAMQRFLLTCEALLKCACF